MEDDAYFAGLRLIIYIASNAGRPYHTVCAHIMESIIINLPWVVVAFSLHGNRDSLFDFQGPITVTDV